MTKGLKIPNFCNNQVLLFSLVATQICLSSIWLLAGVDLSFVSYGLWTYYVQGVVLFNCAVLCLCKLWLQRLPSLLAAIFLIGVGLSSVIAAECFIYYLFESPSITPVLDQSSLRRALALVLAYIVILRVFSLINMLDGRSKAEVNAKLQILQSKIQPHFLFNSLNTISALVSIKPNKAEEAIQALAMLFRVGLEEGENRHSLEQELRLCDRFVALECWRFEVSPCYTKDIQVQNPECCSIPKLLIQPLLENALKYGSVTEENTEQLRIELNIRETAKAISIKLTNTYDGKEPSQHGHGLALKNIAERLAVLYPDQHFFRVKADAGQFQVTVKFPKQQQMVDHV